MSSAFLKKLEEEKKQAESGELIDQDMKEEDEGSDYDEEADGVKELNEVHDGIGAIALGKGGPVAPTQKMPALADPSHAYTKIPKPASHSALASKQAAKYEPAEWTEFFDSREMLNEVVPIYHAGTGGHVFLCLHGAGHSALSFAALARILKGDKYKSTCVSFDFRGHGSHFCENEQELSQQNLINETIAVIQHIAQKYPSQSIIMVGHSMGGSIATKATDFIMKNHENESWAKHIKGMFIIDVVEGSALDALPFMESIVKSRPTQFSNL
jgi:protein phosphatase methylesterase 1|tara:strand:+ start:97 stop:906 length:810 start_codon:yes stop_codon:yes gene_type:complete